MVCFVCVMGLFDTLVLNVYVGPHTHTYFLECS